MGMQACEQLTMEKGKVQYPPPPFGGRKAPAQDQPMFLLCYAFYKAHG
jgi:hypothetical protein